MLGLRSADLDLVAARPRRPHPPAAPSRSLPALDGAGRRGPRARRARRDDLGRRARPSSSGPPGRTPARSPRSSRAARGLGRGPPPPVHPPRRRRAGACEGCERLTSVIAAGPGAAALRSCRARRGRDRLLGLALAAAAGGAGSGDGPGDARLRRNPLKPAVWAAADDGAGKRRGARARTRDVSPDGQWIAYMRRPKGRVRPRLMVVPADGSAPPRMLAKGWCEPYVFAWSPDSSTIAAVRGPELGRSSAWS